MTHLVSDGEAALVVRVCAVNEDQPLPAEGDEAAAHGPAAAVEAERHGAPCKPAFNVLQHEARQLDDGDREGEGDRALQAAGERLGLTTPLPELIDRLPARVVQPKSPASFFGFFFLFWRRT